MSRIVDLELEYINRTNWLVRENANVNESAITMFWYIAKQSVLEEVLKYIPPRAVRAHKEGWLHINKLFDGGWFLPYCCGVDTARILQKGLITPNVTSRPPKHLDSAVDQLANFIMMMSQERTGAIGLNAIDLYLAPFVAHDKLSYEQVKQCMQRFIYNLNYTTRTGYQTPFSNITLVMGVKEYHNAPAYVGGRIVGRLGDYLEEAKLVLKALCEVFLEGDAYGRPFSVAGDEYTIVKIGNEVKVCEIGRIIDEFFEKYGELVINRAGYEILPLFRVGIDFEVIGLAHGIPIFQRVLFLVRHKERELYEIETEDGFTVKVTGSHSVLVWDGDKIVCKKASELKVGEFLVRTLFIPSLGEELNEINIAEVLKRSDAVSRLYVKFSDGKIMRLDKVDPRALTKDDKIRISGSKYEIPAVVEFSDELAYLLTMVSLRGSFSKKRDEGDYELTIRFRLEEEKIAQRTARAIEKVFNIEPRIRKREDRGTIEVRVRTELVIEPIRILIGGDVSKRIPDIIFRAPWSARVMALRAVSDLYGRMDPDYVTIELSNRELFMTTTYLLMTLATPFKVEKLKSGRYRIVINIVDVPLRIIERRVKELLASACTDGSGFIMKSKIVKIRKVTYNGYVYDFTTSSETFLASVFMLHNTFPIPTVIVTEDWIKIIEEDEELSRLFWRTVAERGSFYFLNSLTSDRTGIFSFCCRLTADMRKVAEYLHMSRGVWALPPSTGSIGYVTINLPRIAIEASMRGDAEKYIDELLYEYMTIGREVLNVLRARYVKLHRLGYYPLTRLYIDEYDPFKYYYNTIAVTGMAEYAAIVLNEPRLWMREISPDGREYVKDVISVYRRTFEYMGKILEEFEEEDRVLYNLEQAPAESSSYRFARLDWERYPKYREFIPCGVDPYTGNKEPYYTSQNTPPYSTWRLETQIKVESETQRLFTGGVMKHIFVHRPVPEDRVKKLILTICRNTDIVYMSYAPTQSICLDCGYRSTEILWECPKCGSKNIEQWTRIVGYYRPVRSWNPGRRAEFASRRDLAADFA
ncbi:MAG: hypothetical protein GXO26_01650 [Crenarchaeota archaeon]|nr:hypothetical protein [Thermoproteota archaeon]